MRKILVGLAAAMALSATGTANAALPTPQVYPVWCGYTAVYTCGICVEFAGGLKNCTYW